MNKQKIKISMCSLLLTTNVLAMPLLAKPIASNDMVTISANDNETYTYNTTVSLQKASDPSKKSMANGALNPSGKVVIENGKWYLIPEFKTLKFMGVYGNADKIGFYEDYAKKQLLPAQIISYRNDAIVSVGNKTLTNQKAVKEVKIPINPQSDGVYVAMYIDFMKTLEDAYIKVDMANVISQYSNELKTKIQNLSATKLDSAKQAKLTNYLGTIANDYTGVQKLENLHQQLVNLNTNTDPEHKPGNDAGHTPGSDTNTNKPSDSIENKPSGNTNSGNSSVKPNSNNNLNNTVNKNSIVQNGKLSDGIYEVNVDLWNAHADKPSMAAPSFEKIAKIEVKNGIARMFIKTKTMTIGNISAQLEDLKVKNGNNYELATRNGFDFNFSFIPNLAANPQYLDVLVNPHVAAMGNEDIPARIRINWSTIKKSDSLSISGTASNTGNTTVSSNTNTSTPSGNILGNGLIKNTGNIDFMKIFNIAGLSLIGLGSLGLVIKKWLKQ